MAERVGAPLNPMEAFRQRAGPLWVGALGIHFLVVGQFVLRRALGDHANAVSWTIYLSLLLLYVPLVWVIARVIPRVSPPLAGTVRAIILSLSVVEVGFYTLSATPFYEWGAVLAALVTVLPLGYAKSRRAGGPEGPAWISSRLIPVLIAGAFGWMCAASLVSWRGAVGWLFSANRIGLTLVTALVLVVLTLPAARDDAPDAKSFPRWWDYGLMAALAAFSFRTYPIVDFHAWELYIGPIEQLRHGGLLLWDTPSPVGLLSVLVPTVLPGNPWTAFWFWQSTVLAVVAAMMYAGLRQLGGHWMYVVLAFMVSFATLFFQPRGDDIMVASQTLPSGGPLQLVWCFVMLAFIASHYLGGPKKKHVVSFARGGTAIWLISLLWSAQAGFYCSVIWFMAYGVYIAQEAFQLRDDRVPSREVLRRVAIRIAVPLGALVAMIAVITLGYLAIAGHAPDWRSYLEFATLYNHGALPPVAMDHSGTVWYLTLIFLVVSTVAAMYIVADARDLRIVVLAGVWGAVWSVGSAFIGTSQPWVVRSLTPLLLFAVAIVIRVFKSDRSRRWQRLVFAALMPAFIIPITLTFGHYAFRSTLREAQPSGALISDQIPLVESTLMQLLRAAGAHPSDAYVRVDEARWQMPAWPIDDGRSRTLATRSWLPQPYELIGDLSPGRRQLYIDRNASRWPSGGWLIRSRSDSIPADETLVQHLAATHHEARRFENRYWVLSWMATGPAASSTVQPAPHTSLPARPQRSRDSTRR